MKPILIEFGQAIQALASCLYYSVCDAMPDQSWHRRRYHLNLKNADLQSLIETVAEITGKNFIVDPRVKAKVTVVSARPMDRGRNL